MYLRAVSPLGSGTGARLNMLSVSATANANPWATRWPLADGCGFQLANETARINIQKVSKRCFICSILGIKKRE